MESTADWVFFTCLYFHFLDRVVLCETETFETQDRDLGETRPRPLSLLVVNGVRDWYLTLLILSCLFIFCITVYSFVHLTRKLLEQTGVQAILSEKWCQDALEQYFSRQRAAGGGNDNSSVSDFGNNTLSLQVSSACSQLISKSQHGTNTRCKRPIGNTDLINCSPLQKKPRWQPENW